MWNALADRIQLAFSRSALGRRVALKMRNQCNMIVHRSLSPFLDDPEANGEYWILEHLGDGIEIAVDVGANRGDWARSLARRAPRLERLVCFEPAEAAFRRLGALTEELGNRLVLRQLALSDEVGVAGFLEEAGEGQRSSLFPVAGVDGSSRVEVRTGVLDEEIEALGLPRIDFLKIDAEGSDFRVLRGAERMLSRSAIGFVQFEYNAPWVLAGSTLTAATRHLESFGYRVFLLQQGGLYTVDLRTLGEYFAYSNYLAVAESNVGAIAGLVRELEL